MGNRIGVVGAEIAKGQRKLGVEDGPFSLRISGALKGLQLHYDLTDYGDVSEKYNENPY